MRQTKKDRYFAMYKGDKYVDGGCIMELHQLADEALALASGQILNEGDL